MTKINYTQLGIFIKIGIFLFYGFLVNTYYRPYIYSHKINDFGLADIGNNITFIPGTYFLLRLFNQKYIYSQKGDIIFYFIHNLFDSFVFFHKQQRILKNDEA